jgi:hypothetical protein
MAAGGQGLDIAELAVSRKASVIDLPAVLPQRDLYSGRPAAVRAGPDRIEWSWGEAKGLPGAPGSECLFNFLKLADSDDLVDFVRYANVHGVLGLTVKGLPGTFGGENPPTVSGEPAWNWEPVNLWKAYAQNAKMLLILTMALRADKRIDPIEVLENAGFAREDLYLGEEAGPPFKRVYERDERDFRPGGVSILLGENDMAVFAPVPGLTNISLIHTAKNVASQRRALMVWLEHHWLGLADIVPTVEWSSGPARLVLRLSRTAPKFSVERATFCYWPLNTLFSVLAAELTGIICSDRYVAQCRRCLALHPSRIKVRTDQPNYCDHCRLEVRRATNRNAARKRYQRQKAERAAD